jgi:hypothetical protein
LMHSRCRIPHKSHQARYTTPNERM